MHLAALRVCCRVLQHSAAGMGDAGQLRCGAVRGAVPAACGAQLFGAGSAARPGRAVRLVQRSTELTLPKRERGRERERDSLNRRKKKKKAPNFFFFFLRKQSPTHQRLMQEQEGFGVNCMQEISHILSPGSLLSVTVYDGAALQPQLMKVCLPQSGLRCQSVSLRSGSAPPLRAPPCCC